MEQPASPSPTQPTNRPDRALEQAIASYIVMLAESINPDTAKELRAEFTKKNGDFLQLEAWEIADAFKKLPDDKKGMKLSELLEKTAEGRTVKDLVTPIMEKLDITEFNRYYIELSRTLPEINLILTSKPAPSKEKPKKGPNSTSYEEMHTILEENNVNPGEKETGKGGELVYEIVDDKGRVVKIDLYSKLEAAAAAMSPADFKKAVEGLKASREPGKDVIEPNFFPEVRDKPGSMKKVDRLKVEDERLLRAAMDDDMDPPERGQTPKEIRDGTPKPPKPEKVDPATRPADRPPLDVEKFKTTLRKSGLFIMNSREEAEVAGKLKDVDVNEIKVDGKLYKAMLAVAEAEGLPHFEKMLTAFKERKDITYRDRDGNERVAKSTELIDRLSGLEKGGIKFADDGERIAFEGKLREAMKPDPLEQEAIRAAEGLIRAEETLKRVQDQNRRNNGRDNDTRDERSAVTRANEKLSNAKKQLKTEERGL